MTCSSLPLPAGGFVPIPAQGWAHDLSIFLLVALPVLTAGCCLVFLYFKPTSALLRKRSNLHLFIGVCACLCMLGYTAVFDYAGNANFPCLVLLFLFHLGGLSLGTVPLIMKMVIYTNEISSLRVARAVQQSALKSSSRTVPTEDESSGGGGHADPFSLRGKATWESFAIYCRFVIRPQARKRATPHERVLKLQFMKSHAYIALWVGLAYLIGVVTCIVRIATDPRLQHNCNGCVITREDAISNLVMALWGQLAGPCTVPARLVDRLGVLHEFRWSFYSCVFTAIGLVVYLANPAGVEFNWLNFTLLQTAFNLVLATLYPVYLARKTLRGLQHFNAEECFAQVQQDRNLKFLLRKHLDEELSSEVYWFLDAVDAFVATDNRAAMVAKALVVHAEFVQLGSLYEINLSSQVRLQVTRKMTLAQINHDDENAGGIDVHVFDECVREVKSSLLSDGFLRFLQRLDEDKRHALVAVSN